jgi:hypothetical protein
MVAHVSKVETVDCVYANANIEYATYLENDFVLNMHMANLYVRWRGRGRQLFILFWLSYRQRPALSMAFQTKTSLTQRFYQLEYFLTTANVSADFLQLWITSVL